MEQGEEFNFFNKEKYSGAYSNFLTASINKIDSMVRHLDTQINILITLSSAILLFSVTQFAKEASYFFALLGSFSLLAVIAGLFAIHPPKQLRKKGQKESLMYIKNIANNVSYHKYLESIQTTVANPNLITEQFAIEMYNMATYYYLPKRKLFKISRNFLLVGIILSSLVYLSGYLSLLG